ncbi:transposase [Pseudomonas guariconensis]|uniref:transposase n=1 Tax=Pseudomonas guariconensis TaxID=1288410 RepID=UPI001E49BA69|nr:transposase [Pseudomonas guariconensis]
MIQYPAELPLPLQDGYGYSTADPMRSTPMVTGRRRYRRVHSYVPSTLTLNFIFEWDEAAFFDAWYARTLNDGLEWFEIPLQLQPGFQKYQVHFTGIYSRTELDQVTRWRYSFEAELKERPLIPEGWEQFPEYWFNKGVIDIAVNQQWPLSKYEIYMDSFDYGVNREWPEA